MFAVPTLSLNPRMSSFIVFTKKAGGNKLKPEQSQWSPSCYTTTVKSVHVAVG